MSQFTTAEEAALTSAYLQCDLAPAKRPDFALVISGWPRIYTCHATYALASGSHNLSTTKGFTTTYAWGKAPEFASSKLKEGIPEAGGFSIGNMTMDVLDKYGESTLTRDLTELVSRQAFRESNRTGSEYELATALTKSGTTVTLTSASGLATGSTIWIGSEAILLGNDAASPTFTGCTRGYLMTNAVPHEQGVAVYGYLPALKGRPIWIYKGYQDLALSSWLPMWGGTIEHVGRTEPGVVRFTGRPTEWEAWGGSANGGLLPLGKIEKGANAPTFGARKIARLGQIADERNEENFSVFIVHPTLNGDFSATIAVGITQAQAATLGDGHYSLKLGNFWFGIASVAGIGPGDGTATGLTVLTATLVRGLVTGGFPVEIPDGQALDLAWTNATYSATAAPTGSDPIDLLLQLLTSTGTGNNGAYDTLERGIGLGIAVERIDLDSFTDVQGQLDYDDLSRVFFLFSKSELAKPFFDTELCKPFGWYLSTGNDGRIKLVRPKNPTKFYFSRANNDFSLTASNSGHVRHFYLPSGVYTAAEVAAALQVGLRAVIGRPNIAVSVGGDGTDGFVFEIDSGDVTLELTIHDTAAWRTLGWSVFPDGPSSSVGVQGLVGGLAQTSFNTITENDVIAGSISQSGEAPQIGLVKFGCNYHWNEERFDYKVFVDQETANLSPYGEAPAYQVESKGLLRAFSTTPNFKSRTPFAVLLPPANATSCEGSHADVTTSAGIDASDSGATLFCEHLFDRYRNPPTRFKCRLKWKFNTKEIGDCLLWNYAPNGVFLDGENAADVLTNRIFEIVGIRPMPGQGCVEVDLLGHREGVS